MNLLAAECLFIHVSPSIASWFSCHGLSHFQWHRQIGPCILLGTEFLELCVRIAINLCNSFIPEIVGYV